MALPEAKAGTSIQEEPLTWYSWVVAILCLLSFAVSFVCRNVWSTALPVAAPALKISMTAAGGLMTAFYIGYVISNFFTGFVVDRIGPRKTLAAASLLTGLFTLLIPFAGSYAVIFILRIGAGIASGPLFSGCTKFQLAWFPQRVRATAMGLVMAGPTVGMTIASSVFAPIIKSQGWQASFTYAGIITLAVAVLTYLFAKERGIALATSGQVKKELTEEEKAQQRKGLLEIIFKRQFILGTFGQLFSVGIMNGFATWAMMFFTKAQGFTLSQAGVIFGVTTFVMLFTTPLGGIVSDVLKARKITIHIGNAANFIFTIALLLTKNMVYLWIFMFCRSLLGAMANNLNTMMAESVTGPYAGRAMGIYNGVCQLGSVIFPTLFGFILDTTGSFTAVMVVLASLSIIMSILVAFMDETYKKAPTAA